MSTFARQSALLLPLLLAVSACSTPQPAPAQTQALPTRNATAPQPPATPAAPASWAAGLSIDQVALTADHASSTQLHAQWSPAPGDIDHYELTYQDAIAAASHTLMAPGSSLDALLAGLKSSTAYTVSLRACLDSACQSAVAADASSSASTPEEVWQLQGSGHSYETAAQVVDNGSTLSYALHYGPEAGPDLDGHTLFYFHPGPDINWMGGMRMAVNNAPGSDLAAVSYFATNQNGLKNICHSPNQPETCLEGLALRMLAFQPVPMAGENLIRLFFEATDLLSDTTQLYYLDSYDGYIGQDFNSGPGAVCEGEDYAANGSCPLHVALAIGDQSGLTQARQSKLGYPTQDSWLWDGAAGAYMVITGADVCNQTTNGLFYAVWDGSQWNTEKDGSCPRPLVLSGHGPVIVHLGGDNYKLYYEDSTNGNNAKPLHLIYASGGADGQVAFEDWENESAAREVNFLWPDGTPLNPEEESGLGDHMIYLPNGDTSLQVMYMNLGGFDNAEWNQPSAGLGIAVLLNP